VAALTVVDTNADDQARAMRPVVRTRCPCGALHKLVVLQPYRAMNLPLKKILEAHRRFPVSLEST
jgi:hypothetical protein